MNHSVEFLDKYVKVIDRRNNSVVASGKVIGSKSDYYNGGISFDNKWFFRETDKLKFEVVDFVETKLLEQDPKELGLKWDYLHIESNEVDNLDVRRDFGYDELDPEIAEYIYKLNDISNTIKTTTSCCGHKVDPWYVEFEFSEFWDLSKFVNTVELFKGEIELTTNRLNSPTIRKKNIHLVLQPTIPDPELKLLDSFCKKLHRVMVRGDLCLN